MSRYDARFKIIVIGEGAVGKTTLTHRFLTGLFGDTYHLTIGIEFFVHDININNNIIKLQIWDFAGEERFRFLLPSYAMGAMGGLFVFDVTRLNTLYQLPVWLKLLRESAGNIPILMVGTKIDLHRERKVQSTEAIEMAKNHNLSGYAEVSSKTGLNVDKVFETIAKLTYKKQFNKII